jgi:hypothetical protein
VFHNSVELQPCCLGGGEKVNGKISATWIRRCEALRPKLNTYIRGSSNIRVTRV